MPSVEVRETIAASVSRVWDLLLGVESYPDFMGPVRSIEILEEGDDWAVTSWEVELKGSVLKWTEREHRDPAGRRITYKQIDGDLEELDGFWQLRELSADSTEVLLSVRFEIGIPMLREMLNPVAERAIRDNSRKMLQSLTPLAAAAEDRHS